MSGRDELGVRARPGMGAHPEVFIYYRVEAADEATIRQHVAAFQHALCSGFDGLQARLLRSHGGPSEGTQLTLMENYSMDAGAGHGRIELHLLLAAIAQGAVSIESLIQGSRHVEVFEPCV